MPTPAESPAAEVELISDPQGIGELEPDWRQLAVARGNAFVTPEWFRCWLRHYGGECEPFVIVVRSAAGELVGLLPFVVSNGRRRTAGFAGSGLGDDFHPVAPAEREAEVAAVAGKAMRSRSQAPPTLLLENVTADATWWPELSQSAGYGQPVTDRHSSLPYAELGDGGWDEYLASRSRNLRSQIGRKRRALEREHEVRFRWARGEDDVSADMRTLFRLHDMRWEARAGDSSLTSARARAFHADFAGEAQRHGWLRLCFLEVDREPVAAWYGWRIGARFAYYQAGLDPAWSGASAGFVLFAETIRAATIEGASRYEMLLGDEGFKQRFADSARPACTAFVAPRLHPRRVLAAAEVLLRSAGRRLPGRIREPAKRGTRSLLERLPLARHR